MLWTWQNGDISKPPASTVTTTGPWAPLRRGRS
jgi:hypothetical protein